MTGGFGGLKRGLIAFQKGYGKPLADFLNFGDHLVRSFSITTSKDDMSWIVLCKTEDCSLANSTNT